MGKSENSGFFRNYCSHDLEFGRCKQLIEILFRNVSIDSQGHFFTIYFPGFVCFVLYLAKISGERLQDHWSSGCFILLLYVT